MPDLLKLSFDKYFSANLKWVFGFNINEIVNKQKKTFFYDKPFFLGICRNIEKQSIFLTSESIILINALINCFVVLSNIFVSDIFYFFLRLLCFEFTPFLSHSS